MLNCGGGHRDNLEMAAAAQTPQAQADLVTKPKSLLQDYADMKFLVGGKAKHLLVKACYQLTVFSLWAGSGHPAFEGIQDSMKQAPLHI